MVISKTIAIMDTTGHGKSGKHGKHGNVVHFFKSHGKSTGK